MDVEPRSANFGRLAPDAWKNASLTEKLTIVNNMDAEAKLTNVESTNASFQAQVRAIEPGKKYELTVSVISGLKVGYNRGKVEMSTGIEDMPTLSVPVSAYLMTDVDVRPNRLVLRAQRLRDMKRRFTVTNNTDKPLQISDLQASDPALTVALKELRPGRTFTITVDVPIGYHSPPDGDKITFKTDSPSAPVVTIPVGELTSTRRVKVGRAGRSVRTQLPSGRRMQNQPASNSTETGSDGKKKTPPGNVRP